MGLDGPSKTIRVEPLTTPVAPPREQPAPAPEKAPATPAPPEKVPA